MADPLDFDTTADLIEELIQRVQDLEDAQCAIGDRQSDAQRAVYNRTRDRLQVQEPEYGESV